jgi:hypothetical protein
VVQYSLCQSYSPLQLWYKSSHLDNMWTNQHGYVSITLYLWTSKLKLYIISCVIKCYSFNFFNYLKRQTWGTGKVTQEVRSPAYQKWGPEFKPQWFQKQTNKKSTAGCSGTYLQSQPQKAETGRSRVQGQPGIYSNSLSPKKVNN